MSRLLARRLPWLAAAAAVAWLLVLGLCGYALITAHSTFEDVGAYGVGGALAVAILLTTSVLLGVEVRGAGASVDDSAGFAMQGFYAVEVPVREGTRSAPRGPALLGVAAALFALLFVWFVPVWAGLLIWAVVATVLRTRASGLTSTPMRVVLLVGLGVFAVAVPTAGLVAYSNDAVGIVMWLAVGLLALVLAAWHIELTMRTSLRPDPAPSPPTAS